MKKNLDKTGKKAILHKFEKLKETTAEKSAEDKLAIVLDLETTGLSREHDEIIEVAFRPFYFCSKTFKVTKLARKFILYNEPSSPIREEITRITGITDEMVKGESVDWAWLRNMLNSADYVICHNAAFDRGFLENTLEKSGNQPTDNTVWACSMKQIDWQEFCRPSKALEVLCAWSGFFYDSHRAHVDIDALLHLLREESKIEEIISNASTPDYRVFAMNSPREMNHLLKRRWYRWDPSVSMWWKNTSTEKDAEKETEWLKDNLEGVEPQIFPLEPKYRFAPE